MVESYSWDFETLTTAPTRVWAWSQVNINDFNDIQVGNTIDSFMELILSKTCNGFFHNLKFDGEFIMQWLMTHGYSYCKSTKKMPERSFNILMSDMGSLYKITITVEKRKKVVIRDSLKLLPFKVEKIAKDFNLELNGKKIRKLSIDYKAYREVGHELTPDEKEYVIYDTLIMAMALNYLQERGMNKLTIGSNALAQYKNTLSDKDTFKRLFPPPVKKRDEFVRKAYKGGFSYVNPMFQNKVLGAGIVLDVNSLYPSVMHNPDNIYPIGNGVYYKGKYSPNDDYPVYFQHIQTSFHLKKDHLPTIQIKNNLGSFAPNDYVKDTHGEIVDLTLTNVDLALFHDQYEIESIVYVDGIMYRGEQGLFTKYIDYWTQEKILAAQEHNPSRRALAKLMLNNLYGKFGTNMDGTGKYPVLEDGVIHYKREEKQERDPIYIPVAAMVTAYARNVTIRAAQKVFYRFTYADTDSLHLIGLDEPEGLKVDAYELGAWKHESTFLKAKFIRAKTYIEYGDEPEKLGENPEQFIGPLKLKVTCCGMPAQCHSQVTFDNFHTGSEYTGKLVPRHVKGGIILEETTFQIQ